MIFLSGIVKDNKGIGANDGKNKNSMKYGCAVKFLAQGGTTSTKDGHVIIENAESILVIMSLATNYKNDYPNYFSDTDPLEKAVETVNKAADKTFGELYRAHLADYRALFERVSFTLGEEESTHPIICSPALAKRGNFAATLSRFCSNTDVTSSSLPQETARCRRIFREFGTQRTIRRGKATITST